MDQAAVQAAALQNATSCIGDKSLLTYWLFAMVLFEHFAPVDVAVRQGLPSKVIVPAVEWRVHAGRRCKRILREATWTIQTLRMMQ